MIVRNMTECQLVEKTSEESVKMVSADLASAKNKREDSSASLSRLQRRVARRNKKVNSPLFELAHVLVRVDHVASFIVNTNHSIV